MNKLFLPTLCLASGFMVSAQVTPAVDPLTDTVPQTVDTLPITDPKCTDRGNPGRKQEEKKSGCSKS